MAEKEWEERIRQERAHDELFRLEFGKKRLLMLKDLSAIYALYGLVECTYMQMSFGLNVLLFSSLLTLPPPTRPGDCPLVCFGVKAEGFSIQKVVYLGGLWVMFELPYANSMSKFMAHIGFMWGEVLELGTARDELASRGKSFVVRAKRIVLCGPPSFVEKHTEKEESGSILGDFGRVDIGRSTMVSRWNGSIKDMERSLFLKERIMNHVAELRHRLKSRFGHGRIEPLEAFDDMISLVLESINLNDSNAMFSLQKKTSWLTQKNQLGANDDLLSVRLRAAIKQCFMISAHSRGTLLRELEAPIYRDEIRLGVWDLCCGVVLSSALFLLDMVSSRSHQGFPTISACPYFVVRLRDLDLCCFVATWQKILLGLFVIGGSWFGTLLIRIDLGYLGLILVQTFRHQEFNHLLEGVCCTTSIASEFPLPSKGEVTGDKQLPSSVHAVLFNDDLLLEILLRLPELLLGEKENEKKDSFMVYAVYLESFCTTITNNRVKKNCCTRSRCNCGIHD
ncbi:hypothetical protein Tco_0598299 [Tanacetum coccineum]